MDQRAQTEGLAQTPWHGVKTDNTEECAGADDMRHHSGLLGFSHDGSIFSSKKNVRDKVIVCNYLLLIVLQLLPCWIELWEWLEAFSQETPFSWAAGIKCKDPIYKDTEQQNNLDRELSTECMLREQRECWDGIILRTIVCDCLNIIQYLTDSFIRIEYYFWIWLLWLKLRI